jgi:hypothetical protein
MNTTKNGVANKVTIASLLVALGIIYGDIGTSPLYVFKAIIGTRDINLMLVYGLWFFKPQSNIFGLPFVPTIMVKVVFSLFMHL